MSLTSSLPARPLSSRMPGLGSRRGAAVLGLALLALPLSCGDDDGAGGGSDAWVQRDAHVGLDADETRDASISGNPDAADVPPSRWLSLDDVVNARDLGGYGAAGGAAVRWRRLLRGGTLSALTSTGCPAYADLGVTTVIDLRESSEQALAPEPACVTSVSTVVSVPMPKILPPSETSYLALMEQSETSVGLLFATLGRAGAGPAYIHCVIGRDRASFASALLLLALGADRAAVLEDFLLSNDAGVAVEPAHLEAVLDAVDAEGGIGPYLTRLGVSSAELDALRAWALE